MVHILFPTLEMWHTTIEKNDKCKRIKPYKDSKGYNMVKIHGKNKLVHRLVAEAFVYSNNNLTEVHHKDKNKDNNSYINLEWCSTLEHRQKHGKPVIALDKNTGEILYKFETAAKAARELKISATAIRDCCRGRCKTSSGYIWIYEEDYIKNKTA